MNLIHFFLDTLPKSDKFYTTLQSCWARQRRKGLGSVSIRALDILMLSGLRILSFGSGVIVRTF
jgi:hypothetical protein